MCQNVIIFLFYNAISKDLLLQFNFITVIPSSDFIMTSMEKYINGNSLYGGKKIGCKIYSDQHVLSIYIEFPFSYCGLDSVFHNET